MAFITSIIVSLACLGFFAAAILMINLKRRLAQTKSTDGGNLQNAFLKKEFVKTYLSMSCVSMVLTVIIGVLSGILSNYNAKEVDMTVPFIIFIAVFVVIGVLLFVYGSALKKRYGIAFTDQLGSVRDLMTAGRVWGMSCFVTSMFLACNTLLATYTILLLS